MTSLEKLADAVKRRQLVVVTGTGVTSALTQRAPTSSWLGLLEDGAKHVTHVDSRRGRLIQEKLAIFHEDPRIEDLLSIADDIRTELRLAPQDRYGRWLATTIGALDVKDPTLAEAIAALDAPIFTTNYDKVLDNALGRSSATWQSPSLMRDIAMGRSSAIGHLHGVWDELETVVFNAIDYHRVINNAQAQAFQDAAFSMRNFLFIGFGAGMDDPNFQPMIDRFAVSNQTATYSHFKLCRDEEVKPGTELDAIVDVPYGARHQDLPDFLRSIAPEVISVSRVDRRAKGEERLLRQVRDNSTLWRENDVLDEKRFEDLVIPPIFLPEPHDQYATNNVLESDSRQVQPMNMESLTAESKVLIIAGGENSGVTTAISWVMHQAVAKRPGTHGVLLQRAFGPGPKPLTKAVQGVYTDWGVAKNEGQEHLVLGVDNLTFESSTRFDRTISDLVNNKAVMKIVGVQQSDTVEIVKELSERGVDDVDVVYLGRFSDAEASEIARRVAPGRERKFVSTVMIIIRDKHLPRTPFTITLLMELLNSGKTLKNQDSDVAVLDEYLNLLLFADFLRVTSSPRMSLRNKRVVIELVARKLVEAREDKAPYSDVAGWISELFEELGWSYQVNEVLEDLKQRRVLSFGPGNVVRFQRSIYLELLAGIAAKNDDSFRELIFASPLELASIVRMYAAVQRNDLRVLDVVEHELSRISVQAPSGTILSSVRKRVAPEALLRESSVSEQDDEQPVPTEDVVDRTPDRTVYYDGSDDSDRPTFLTSRIEDLPPARVAMLVVDLASRVLRDSDELRAQERKLAYLTKLLDTWIMFMDLYQAELYSLPDLDETMRQLFDKTGLPEKGLPRFKQTALRMVPAYLTYSGLSYCLSSPTLDRLLVEYRPDAGLLGEWATLLRTLTLYASGSASWVETLGDLSIDAIRSWLSASFLARFAEYAYITDERLTESQRDIVRRYLRAVINARYDFSSISQRNSAMNNFEADLRRARLQEARRPQRALTVLN